MAPRFGTFRNSFIVREALRFAPAKLNYAAGLRGAVATTTPLLLHSAIARPELAFAGLAGFAVVLADKGGAYRIRARSMAVILATGSLVTLLGTLIGPHALLSAPLVFAVVGLGGFARIFGAEATSIGTLTSVALIVALARPAESVGSALASGAFFLAGGAWAALISLVLWPLRMYRPPRLAVASSLRALADVAESFVGASDDPRAQVKRREKLGKARETMEAARVALGSSRRGRPGPSRRGEQLVALLEASDQLFGTLVALEDGLALERPFELASWVDEVASVSSGELRRAADALTAERAFDRRTASSLRRGIEERTNPATEHVPRILLRALERLDSTMELARAIDDPSAAKGPSRVVPSDLSSAASYRSLLEDNLTLDSAMFRHALRMGITTALVALAANALHVEHGYWATLTCLVIMQPHGAATWAKALQRVLGTVLGAGIAVVIASLVHEPHALLAAVFVFVALGMALLPINYGAFAVFLTPGFVLLAETHAGSADLAWVRVVDTLFGALLALLGSRLLFPLAERDQFRPLMAQALAAVRGLLVVAAEQAPAPPRLRESRRQLGLVLLNAEASYQRLLTESGIQPDESEALLTLLLYTHRLASGLIALAEAAGTLAHAELVERRQELESALEKLGEAVSSRSLLADAPREPHSASSAPDDEGPDRVDILFAQLAVLRDALLRWNARSATPRVERQLGGDLGGAGR